MKEKIVYEESFKKPYPKMVKEALPKLNHLEDGWKCVEAQIMKNGLAERDGKRLEYNILKVYITDET